MPTLASSSSLQEQYDSQFEQIRARFEHSQNGQCAVRERSDLLDTLVASLWSPEAAAGPDRFCLVALGGYGRRALFPYSDVDLMFLSEAPPSEEVKKHVIPKMCQSLWDLHLRASPTTRTLADCGKLHRDNLEFNISLLDCRYICGNAELFKELRTRVLPAMVAREALELQQSLIELTRARHNKYGHTIFHLEPNIKECPGGLRDYQVARWLALISELEKTGVWPSAEDLLPDSLRTETSIATDFLLSVRCFLHYRQSRDLNGLTYELQSQAAAEGIGTANRTRATPAEWMRGYFRHVRSIHRLTLSFDELPTARSGLYRLFESRKSRLSNADFSVVEGRVFLRQLASVQEPAVLFALFEFVARHGLKLAADTERCIEAALPNLSPWTEHTKDLWARFRPILLLPHAGTAVRALHRLGLLVRLFPEFQAIDSFVVRDYYHRYTVDEHSLVAIENLHALRTSENDVERRFRDIFDGLERPELLFLALLFHDVGKGMPPKDHVEGSLEALTGALARLQLAPEDRECVVFLVANHLRMSATVMRRDIFDPAVVEEFSESIATVEHLKMLTLLTYADTKSVNPEALTPWKAEMLWQLYVAAFNHLSRTVDDQRLGGESAASEPIRQVVEAATSLGAKHVASFLEGFPKRYLLTHSPQEILLHWRMHERLHDDDPQLELLRHNGFFDLVMLTLDCPYLFAGVVGTLSSWGMNIVKAEAFSNRAGVVLDTFRFSDRFNTLDLNPGEAERLKRDLSRAVAGEVEVAELMRAKFKPLQKAAKVPVEPRLYMDNSCSAHSTLIEITAQDRPGLLYHIGATLSEHGCNIEVAIVDTQGQAANDVFYVTCAGTKLDSAHQRNLQTALLRLL